MWRKHLDSLIETALKEDLPQGDITSESLVPPEAVSRALILSKAEGVLAGIYVAQRVFQKVDPSISFHIHVKDGRRIKKGDKLAALKGPSLSLLKGERTALNFLQRLSGIATVTNRYVNALAGTKAVIMDTRKTTPGWRYLEKYAVLMGGGVNHRMNLSEMVLIKDNHIKIVGGISDSIRIARKKVRAGVTIEVETQNLAEVKEAMESGADIIMLDNMSLRKMEEVVAWVKGRVPLEASGNITLAKARKIGRIGVDRLSVGALTHSPKSLDIHMKFID